MITHLPTDLQLNCLARVSRLYYPVLSLVSKRFRSLIASPELYQTRKLLGRTENCLYLCISFNSIFQVEPKSRWFTLCHNPNPNPKPNHNQWFSACFRPYRILEKKSTDNFMVPILTQNFHPSVAWSQVSIGSDIYMIGTCINGDTSLRVFFMDCRSHTWHEAPSMQIARKWNTVSVLNEKIYVLDGFPKGSSDLVEIFDPKTQIWEHVASPRAEILGECGVLTSLAIDGKLYVFGDKSMVYNPEEKKWDVVEQVDTAYDFALCVSTCVIDNKLYCSAVSGMLQWYDLEGRSWRVFKGLEELPKLPKCCTRVKLVDYGGKIAVLWEKKMPGIVGFDKKMIWCAVIALERQNEQEVYGKIEWCDVVLTVPRSFRLEELLTVNV